MRRKNSGISLIELVSVLFILGSVSVTAGPAFTDLRGVARQRVLADLFAKVRYEAEAARVFFAAKGGDPSAASASVTINGTSVSFQYGYPKDDNTGIARLLSFKGDLTYPVGYTAWAISTAVSNCYVRYYAPASAGSSATVLSASSGC